MRICKAAEAAAPPGGTTFTKEAVDLLSTDLACTLVPAQSNDKGGIVSQQCSYSVLKPEIFDTSRGPTVREAYSSVSINTAEVKANRGQTSSTDLWSWRWDVFKDNDESHLPSIALKLLQPSLACSLIISQVAAKKLIAALCASYSRLPFHNAFHGVAVMQTALLLARSIPASRSALTDFDVCLLAIAALGHDAGHKGYNNAFEVASRSVISLLHGNEGPVLERYHAA